MKQETEKKYYTAKHERFFYSVMIGEKHILMESLLETILGEPVEILEYPRTQLKIKNKNDKAKVSDIIIKLKGRIIHVEIETGVGVVSQVKNFTNFCNLYCQNSIRGQEYDTKTMIIHICLQFGEESKDYLKKQMI